MKKYTILIVLIILIGCNSQKPAVDIKPLTQDEFLENPFGFKETIDNFTKAENPKFNTKKLLRRNKHYPEKTDTIYQFSYKKSEIFFYKTYTGKEFLLAGKVLNKQIEFRNYIHVGIKKEDFIKRFTEKLEFTSDSVQMIGEGTKYTFIFENDKLQRVNIDNYFD